MLNDNPETNIIPLPEQVSLPENLGRRRFLIDMSKYAAILSVVSLPFGSWLKYIDMLQGLEKDSGEALKKISDIKFGNFRARLIFGSHDNPDPHGKQIKHKMRIDEKDLDPLLGGFF